MVVSKGIHMFILDVDNFDNFIIFYKFLTAHKLRELTILNMLQMFLSLQFLSFDSVNDELYS